MASSTLEGRTITVPSIVSSYSDSQLNSGYHTKAEYANAITKYGAIYKVVSFSEISDVDTLKQFCRAWIKDNYYDGVLAFTIKAVDLHLLGYGADKIQVGDRIEVEFLDDGVMPTTRRLTCLSIQYDIMRPENTTYKIGIPDVSANKKYRNSLTARSSSGSKPSSGVTQADVDSTVNQTLIDNGLIIYA